MLPPRWRSLFWCLMLLAGWSAGCHRSGQSAPRLMINEVMAGGAARPLTAPDGSLLVDDEGQPADWVEIYNPLSVPVSLQGYSLSDEPGQPRKFRFPGMMIQPGQYLVVALDNRPEAGPLHASFGLRGSGESVSLYAKDGGVLLDRMAYREAEDDATVGRYPDGAGGYSVIYVPTPGGTNRLAGVKPPRLPGQPQVTPGGGVTPDELALVFSVVEDAGVPILRAEAEAAMVDACSSPFPADPGQVRRYQAVEVSRRQLPDEMRHTATGEPFAQAQEEIRFSVSIPAQPSGTSLWVRLIAENGAGTTEKLDCFCLDCALPTLVINEFQPSNSGTIIFDRYSAEGVLNVCPDPGPCVAPDWLEIYNYGTQEVDLRDIAIVTQGTLDAIRAGSPPDFIWTFGAVGIEKLGPKQFLIVLADDDNPPAFRSYARNGGTDVCTNEERPKDPERRYRSTTFRISASDTDAFYLLAPDTSTIDAANFNFGGQLAATASFGRVPDGASPEVPLSNFGSSPNGEVLLCPSPEGPNALTNPDVRPTFYEFVFTNPRCPGPNAVTNVVAFLNIDEDTAATDLPTAPRFDVTLEFDAGGRTGELHRGDELDVHRATADELERYNVNDVALGGAVLYFAGGQVPAQPSGTLVELSFRARDDALALEGVAPQPGVPTEASYRFLSGFQKPALVVNEVFPASDPAGPPLTFPGLAEPFPQIDYLEIYSTSNAPLDVSGSFLHDEDAPARLQPEGGLRELELPAGTVIAPHGFLTVFFPGSAEEEAFAKDKLAPLGAVVAPTDGMGLNDCTEAIFLLSSDAQGNCLVASGQWDLQSGNDCPGGEVRVAGRFPDGCPSADCGPILTLLPNGTSPGASNCGRRLPEFRRAPFHSRSTQEPRCAAADESSFVRAWVLVDSFAAQSRPGSPAAGIKEATLLIRRGTNETRQAMSASTLSPPAPPDACWVQYQLSAPLFTEEPLTYRVRLIDAFDNVLESEEVSYRPGPPLFINEIMVRNTSTLEDEAGSFPPWIELYNAGPEPQDLGGMELTDEPDQQGKPRVGKWRFPSIPETVIPPNGCLAIFADGEAGDTRPLHATIRLAESGPATLFLLEPPERGGCEADSFAYDATGLAADVSIGLVPDGSPDAPRVLNLPTPCSDRPAATFLRGDVNENGRVGISDTALLFDILHEGAPGPSCRKILDVNDDGAVNDADGAYLINALFNHGPAIRPPYPDPGVDPTPDDLPCP